jgi:hypothetical protein
MVSNKIVERFYALINWLVVVIFYTVVLGGELAVPSSRNPLMRG